MTFERPEALWLLALAAPIVVLHLHYRKRRLVEVSSLELWRGLVPDRGGRGALRQIRDDSVALDASALPVGPFARLDANAVAAQDGKTRGAITNLFGSQAAFQAATMAGS